MQNSTPEWATIGHMEKDYAAFSRKQRRTRTRRIIGRVVWYVAMAVLGAILGTMAVGLTDANAGSQTQVNRYIVNAGGIPPCIHEDGSGQKSTCVWWAAKRGNGKGDSYLAITTKGGDDKIVYITGPKARRY